LNPSSINGLNLYSYANNTIGITYNCSGVGGIVSNGKCGLLTVSGVTNGESCLTDSTSFSVKYPSQNWLSLSIDFTAGMSGALNVFGWTLKNPEFYEFWYSAYGISKYEMLSNLKSPIAKIATTISYGFIAYDTYMDVMGHINDGDTWQTTVSSGIVTAGLGTFNVLASTKTGAFVGTTIGGAPGFIIGTAIGGLVGVFINGVFYTEVNGNSIAGHIQNGIEWFLDLMS